jgi:hypothetical protein
MKRATWIGTPVTVVVPVTVVLLACAERSPGPSLHVRRLVTRYESTLSAPNGPSGYLVARNRSSWDSGWRALGLPGSPPAVDFSRELAVLKATAYGGSPMVYSSRIERAELDSSLSVLSIYVRLNDTGGGVDTSSRKVVAAAISADSNQPPWQGTVVWRVIR